MFLLDGSAAVCYSVGPKSSTVCWLAEEACVQYIIHIVRLGVCVPLHCCLSMRFDPVISHWLFTPSFSNVSLTITGCSLVSQAGQAGGIQHLSVQQDNVVIAMCIVHAV